MTSVSIHGSNNDTNMIFSSASATITDANAGELLNAIDKTPEFIVSNPLLLESIEEWATTFVPKYQTLIYDTKQLLQGNNPDYNRIFVIWNLRRAWNIEPTENQILHYTSMMPSKTRAEVYCLIWEADECRKCFDCPPTSSRICDGKVCVIAGGSSGMGFSGAVEMALQGAKIVYCLARTKLVWDAHIYSALKGTADADRYPSYYGPIDISSDILDKIQFIECDLRLPSDISKAFANIETDNSGIDVLWMNSGVVPSSDPSFSYVEWPKVLQAEVDGSLNSQLTPHRWSTTKPDDIIQATLLTILNTWEYAIPLMNSNATIAITSSLASTYNFNVNTASYAAYFTAKSAIRRMLTSTLNSNVLTKNTNLNTAKLLVLCPDALLTDATLTIYGIPQPKWPYTVTLPRDTGKNFNQSGALEYIRDLSANFTRNTCNTILFDNISTSMPAQLLLGNITTYDVINAYWFQYGACNICPTNGIKSAYIIMGFIQKYYTQTYSDPVLGYFGQGRRVNVDYVSPYANMFLPPCFDETGPSLTVGPDNNMAAVYNNITCDTNLYGNKCTQFLTELNKKNKPIDTYL